MTAHERNAPDFPGGSRFDGNRWNDLHHTIAMKTAARERKRENGRALGTNADERMDAFTWLRRTSRAPADNQTGAFEEDLKQGGDAAATHSFLQGDESERNLRGRKTS